MQMAVSRDRPNLSTFNSAVHLFNSRPKFDSSFMVTTEAATAETSERRKSVPMSNLN